MKKEKISEILRLLGEAISTKTEKDFWIGEAIKVISQLIEE